MLSLNFCGVQIAVMDILLNHINGRRPLELSKGSNTLLTSLMHFPWPKGTTGDVTREGFPPRWG